MHRTVERGVDWIDTAAVYRFGRSEEVARAAKSPFAGIPKDTPTETPP
jgi:aryl-alcohol dehydrogenase-like predicted oxidoreductase